MTDTDEPPDVEPDDMTARLLAMLPKLHPDDLAPKDTAIWGGMFGGNVLRGFGGLAG